MVRRGRALGLLLASSAVVAAGLASAPAPSSAALGTAPVVAFLSIDGRGAARLAAGPGDGSGSAFLTPLNYRAMTFDVSTDGAAYVVGLGHPDIVGNALDRTSGLALVRRSSGAVTTVLLSSRWDDAVISASGSTVWWLDRGDLWRFSGGRWALMTRALRPAAGWRVAQLVVSPDGQTAVVSYAATDGSGERVLVAPVTGAPAATVVDQTSCTYADRLFWQDAGHVVLGADCGTAVTWSVAATAEGGVDVVPAEPDLAAALADARGLRRLGSTWWAWRAVGDAVQQATASDLVGFATATWGARTDAVATSSYVPATGLPPSMTTPLNRIAPWGHLQLTPVGSSTGSRAIYKAWASYLLPVADSRTVASDGSFVYRGTLQKSLDGSTWTTVGVTSWDAPVLVPGSTWQRGNGWTPVLTRNTWFRWRYSGDLLSFGVTSPVRKVSVSPRVTAYAVPSASGSVHVYGTATRTGGTIQLWTNQGGALVRTVTVPISSTGTFSFGWRRLPCCYAKLYVPDTFSWYHTTKYLYWQM